MHLTYEKRENGFSVEWKESVHVPPHLHEAIEIIYVKIKAVLVHKQYFAAYFFKFILKFLMQF